MGRAVSLLVTCSLAENVIRRIQRPGWQFCIALWKAQGDKAGEMLWPSTAAKKVSGPDDPLCYWIQAPVAETMGLTLCNNFPTQKAHPRRFFLPVIFGLN